MEYEWLVYPAGFLLCVIWLYTKGKQILDEDYYDRD